MRSSFVLGTAVIILLPLGACAPFAGQPDTRLAGGEARPHYQGSPQRNSEGRVSGIERLAGPSSGGGALLGALVGGVLGNQVGDGRGRTAATGVGAIGGAVVGNRLEQNRSTGAWRVSLDFNDGQRGSYDYQDIGDLQIGDRVRLQNGQISRF